MIWRCDQDDIDEPVLSEPRTTLDLLCRHLAEAAMSVTHHDAAEHEAGYKSEVRTMERKFRKLVLGYVNRRTKRAEEDNG